MLTCFFRSGLIVNELTPTSYLPESTPRMIESNGALTNFASRPSFVATAVKRSTSMPSTVLPSSPRNSFGAYEASEPMASVPFSLISAGTLSARAWSASTLTDSVAEEADSPASSRVSEPHAASVVVRAKAAARAKGARRMRVPPWFG